MLCFFKKVLKNAFSTKYSHISHIKLLQISARRKTGHINLATIWILYRTKSQINVCCLEAPINK